MSESFEKEIDLLKKRIEELEIIINNYLKKKETPKEDLITYDGLKTEDSGKIFEYAICLAFGIKYDGIFKYSEEEARKLSLRLTKLNELFPICEHIASKGSRYDFKSIERYESKYLYLSAKSTKKGHGKVAPQVIGQASPEKFCSTLDIEYSGIKELKKYIQTNIEKILPYMVKYTFDCSNVYYHLENKTIQFITLKKEIDWTLFEYTWTCDYNKWKNSTILKIKVGEKYINLCEFQFHTKSRKNMANRWFYQNILTIFKDNFEIIDL